MNASTLANRFGGVAGRNQVGEIGQSSLQDNHVNGVQRARAAVDGKDSFAQGVNARGDARAHDPAVELRGVGKRYGERVVLDDFDLSIERGSFVAIVGRSGCGKSTLLRLVAGLETPDAGELTRRGEAGAQLDTRIMFQDARLLPWKTVLQNVMLGLGRGARDDARAVLDEVGLLARADEWPARLSGGQRQRVALARALVHRPSLLLLDEPLGALDALTRIEMHALIERLWREHRFTALLVTHDVHEAVALGDRILLVEQGRIALDQNVSLERPRARADARFAALEESVLQRVLGSETPPGGHAPRMQDTRDGLRPTDVRWAL
ncbi:ATP-binding cassette domain-containing protein [Paraburkholderia bannensis]|uniref:ATP-binding cassette domain-containing protein n=1 Tax=Paraburkholderia bannensis TaxID=765414 RepID=UPI002AB79E15|nr:ATP-binding cassette domain-containing protein [Paraburkholderia bannensis]